MTSELRAALMQRYQQVRAATESLAEPLSPEDQGLQSMPDASPTKWHRAHTTWFFETFVLAPRGIPPVDPHYAFLFNSYYEALGPRHARPRRGMLSRPTCAEITTYRQRVDEAILQVLERVAEDELDTLKPLFMLGLAHEEQHQELLLTDILHAFSEHPFRPCVRTQAPALPVVEASAFGWRTEAGGLVEIGYEGSDFHFDNEGPRHRVFLEPFQIASRPINVAEVLAFVKEEGYQRPSLWLSEGFAKIQGQKSPAYSRVEGEALVVFGVDGEREAHPEEAAAHLTYFEADAIARFLDARLPTEAEWEHAARGCSLAGNDREMGALRPLPANGFEPYGGVWEWTSSAYQAYPGYAPAEGAVGEYNGKFLINQQVLRGGSCFTPRGHIRTTYRNFWPTSTSFQMTGARIARSLPREKL